MKNLITLKNEINNELNNFFDKEIENANFSDVTKGAVSYLKEYTLRGGKRLRALLFISSYLCFNELNKNIIRASVYAELMQSYLLIHDDFIDNDDLRRGGYTIHKYYEKKFDKHFGGSMAVNLGDLASSLILKPIINSPLSELRKILVVKKIHETLEKEIYGQILDINFSRRAIKTIKEKEILEMYRLKSVPYTTVCPIYAGAILAGANKDKLKTLEIYADNIGLAFQLIDDNLGMFGNEEETGKPNDSDIREGKRTLLIVKALEEATKKEQVIINKVLGNKESSEEDIRIVKEIVKNNSLEYCKELAEKLANNGISALKRVKLKNEGKELLIYLANYIINRNN